MVSGSILIRFSESITLPTGKDPIKLYHNGSQAAANVTLQEEDWVALLTFSAALVNGQDYTLTITIDLEDKHQNTLSEEFSQPFTYQGADVIVYDRVPPEVEKVELMSDVYHVTLTEEYDPATLPSSVDIFTSTKTYVGTVAAEGPKQFTFTTSQALDANTEYTFRVKTSLKDLSGKNLVEFSVKYAYDGSDEVLFEKPSETLHGESFVKNNVLFQGREYDHETGLYYFRARYYDPKLGLFLQPDPNGYDDSMNQYQAFGNNPINSIDPFGNQYQSTVTPQGSRRERNMSIAEFYDSLLKMGYSQEEAINFMASSPIYGKDFWSGKLARKIKTEKMDVSYSIFEGVKDIAAGSLDDLAYSTALPYMMFAKGTLEGSPGYILGSFGIIFGEAMLGVGVEKGIGFLVEKFPILKKPIFSLFKKPPTQRTIQLDTFIPEQIPSNQGISYRLRSQKGTFKRPLTSKPSTWKTGTKVDLLEEYYKIHHGEIIKEIMKESSTADDFLEAILTLSKALRNKE